MVKGFNRSFGQEMFGVPKGPNLGHTPSGKFGIFSFKIPEKK